MATTNPQKQLYSMLAESDARLRQIRSIRKLASDKIPAHHDRIQGELAQLRDRIRSMGLGGDTEAEDKYLELLQDAKQLDQSRSMHLKDFPQVAEAEEPVEDEQLVKALEYGEFLLSVFEGGALLKSASLAIRSHCAYLIRWSHLPRVEELRSRLEQLQ